MRKFYMLIYCAGRLVNVECFEAEHITRKIFRKMIHALYLNGNARKRPDIYAVVNCHYAPRVFICNVAQIRLTTYYNYMYSDTKTRYQESSVFVNGRLIKSMGAKFAVKRREILNDFT